MMSATPPPTAQIPFPEHLIVEGIALGFERWLASPEGPGGEISALVRLVRLVTLARAGTLKQGEVAEMLGVTTRTVQNWVGEGEVAQQDLPGDRSPRYWLLDLVKMLQPGHPATADHAAPITAAARNGRKHLNGHNGNGKH